MGQYGAQLSTPTSSGQQNNFNDQQMISANPEQTVAVNDQQLVASRGTVDFSKMSINTDLGDKLEEPKDAVGKALQKLVNFDDISSPVEEFALTMNPFAEKKDVSNVKGNKSKGLPPTAASWNLGPQPSLEQMKAVKLPPKVSSEVMKVPSTQYNPGDPNA